MLKNIAPKIFWNYSQPQREENSWCKYFSNFKKISPDQKMSDKSQRTKVFISYSHKDKEWMKHIRVHLAPLEDLSIDIWDDTNIASGEIWKDKIKQTVNQARVAILLVSADFLAPLNLLNTYYSGSISSKQQSNSHKDLRLCNTLTFIAGLISLAQINGNSRPIFPAR